MITMGRKRLQRVLVASTLKPVERPAKTPFPVVCTHCRKHYTLYIHMQDYLDWRQQKLIQNAFPYLTQADRELMKSGMCGECWDGMFKDLEEDS